MPVLPLILALLLCAPAAVLAEAEPAAAKPAPERQYTFSWRFLDDSALAPRGGTTRGSEITLDTAPSKEWQALQTPGLSKFERDRRAILAMAGEYRSSFDFIEVAGFGSGKPFQPDRPYQSWGTEKVYVLEDTGKSIVLQHLLVMSIVGPDGKVQGPYVTKHWRQDWQYEPSEQLVYRGHNTWQKVSVPLAERRGQWRQSVYQVDDSPRYSGVAAWQHLANYSSWGDEQGWRPLPRREFSARHDYDVLIGSNRHTITPNGWIHEQQNLKARLDANGKLAPDAILAREFGLNRYERIRDFDWSAGDQYIQATDAVWKAVREQWAQLAARKQPLHLRGAPDQDQLFLPLFEYADSVAAASTPPSAAEIRREVAQRVQAYLDDGSKPATPAGY